MGLATHFTTMYSPVLALLTVLFAAALAHPDPQVRARAERILGMIFGAR